MRTAPVVLALTLLLGSAACSDDDDGGDGGGTGGDGRYAAPSSAATTAAPTTAATTAPATTAPPTTGATAVPPAGTSAPPFRANTLPDNGGQGSGNGLGLVGVRSARQAGYDRVVFELGGKGTPGWLVQYEANPTEDGSGYPVTIKGTSFLMVILRGVGLPADTGVPQFGSSSTRVPGNGTKQVLEIAPGSVFEGQQLAYIGLSGGKRPFRVFSLTDPPRVVVDVRDS